MFDLGFLIRFKIMINTNIDAIIIATHISKEKNPYGSRDPTNGISK